MSTDINRSASIAHRAAHTLFAVFCAGFAAAMAITPARADPRHAAMVIDANTGEVLHSHAGDEPRHPASLTKMMTLYMTFDLIDQGRLSYQSKIKISEKAAAVAPSKLDLDPGEEIRLIDAIKALITKSANDVAVAIAEEIAGTEANFAKIMTARAREIGMTATTFKNASGLPDPEQVTTARDMLTLALRLQDDFPKHYTLFSTREFTYAGGTYRNHNTLLRSFRGADGIKTGYTRASGFNLVSSVKRDGKQLVGVIFGGHSAPIRNANMRLLLSNALAKASTEKTRAPTAVARLTPIPRPAKPKAVAEARPKPATAAKTKPREAQAPVSPAPVQTAAAGVPASGAIPIAKVRRVMVTPKVATSSAASTVEEPLTPPVGNPPPFATASANAAPRLSPPGASSSPPVASAQRTAAVTPPAATAIAPKKAAPKAEPAGLKAEPAPPSAAAESGAKSAGYQIQIGAYGSAMEAERQLGAVRERTGDLLASRRPVTKMVQKGTRQLFRARFAGFDSSAAASACAELKRQQIDCFVMKAE